MYQKLAALCCLTVLGGAQERRASSLTIAEARATINQVEAIVRREYMDAAVAARAADHLRRRGAAGAYAVTRTPKEMADLLTRDLFAVTRDKHLVVSVIAERPLGAPERAAESRESRARRANGGVQRVEILDGNVGYLNLTSFWRLAEARDPLTAAMRLLQRADAVIIDMRRNSGGSPETAAWLIAHLLEEDRAELFHIQPRTGSAVRYFAEGVALEDRNAKRPVYVLTSSQTFSAGEGFAYLLQERRRATIVGERTAGAANPGRPYPVNERFEVTVPNGRVVSAVRQGNWEGSGVVPDIAIDQAEALETAHKMARQNRKLQYAIVVVGRNAAP